MRNQEACLGSSSFPTTDWTAVIGVVQRGDDDAAWTALTQFCERYRPAIYGFFLRRGCGHERAEDYTQEFFRTRILRRWEVRKGFLFVAERQGGRHFRSFLCCVLWWFLKEQWKAESAQRAGEDAIHVPVEELERLVEGAEDAAFAVIRAELDREIAFELFRRAAGTSTRSKYLLEHFQDKISQADAAKELGLTENAFKQAYHRFRESFRDELQKEVAKLVGPDPEEIKGEIRYLMSLFAESST